MIIDFNTLQRKYSKKEVDKHKLQVIGSVLSLIWVIYGKIPKSTTHLIQIGRK